MSRYTRTDALELLSLQSYLLLMTRSLHEIEADITSTQAHLHHLKEEKGDAIRRSYATCRCCGKKTQIGKLTYIQTHWYVQPHGCNGGDYWKQGEGQFDCPKCGANNRLYNRPEVAEKKPFFATVEDRHER